MLETKYDFIAHDLMSKIFQNYYQEKLPTQRKLADVYAVSRYTIQKALQKLENIGMITPIQGDGIYINKNLSNHNLIYNSMTENSYNNIESKIIYFKKVRVTNELAKIFAIPNVEYIWEYQRIRIVNHVISQVETSFLPCRLFPDFNEWEVIDSIQSYVLRQRMKISHFITNYQAVQINKEQSILLSQKKGYPAMKITNRGILSTGEVYEFSIIIALYYDCTYMVPFNKVIFDSRRKS